LLSDFSIPPPLRRLPLRTICPQKAGAPGLALAAAFLVT
jgi:hypothetical protein